MKFLLCLVAFCLPVLLATAQCDVQTSIRINNYIVTLSQTENEEDILFMPAACWDQINGKTPYNSINLALHSEYNFIILSEFSGNNLDCHPDSCEKKRYNISVNKIYNSIRLIFTDKGAREKNYPENIERLFHRNPDGSPKVIPALGYQRMLIAGTSY